MLTVLDTDTPHSPAMAFLVHAYAHRSRAVQASSRRTKAGMCQTLMLAIKLGLPFARDDFAWLMRQQSRAYDAPSPFADYLTSRNSPTCGEEFYTAAIRHGHTTACQSFEHWKGRKPFFAQGTRLHLGAALVWEGQHTFVTSFDDDAGIVFACSYAQVGRNYRNGRVEDAGYGALQRRFMITHASHSQDARCLHPTTRAPSGAGVERGAR
jgi:hypothetical protein